jgi:hypothetical protein
MVYKRERKYFIYRFIQTLIFPVIVLLMVDDYYWIAGIFLIIILVLFIVWEFYSKRLYAIKIQENEVCLCFFEFFLKKRAIYKLNELMYSYKNEVGARGVKSMEFRIYKNQKVLIKGVGRSLDGWTDAIINELIEEFKTIGIKENDYGDK